jgi:THO complex subunit 5
VLDPYFSHRLDQKKKELGEEKENLLKQSRLKLATMDNIKTQIDTLLKARLPSC